MAGVPSFLDPNSGAAPQGLDELLQSLAQKGQQALASGQISPEDAQKHLEDGKQALISMQKPQTAGPVSMAMPPGMPGRKATNTVTSGRKQNTASNTNTYKSAEEMQQQMDIIRGTPEFQALNEGDQQLQDQIAMTRATKNPDSYWVKPLLALADSKTGTNLMKGYTDGLSKADLNAQLLKYQDEAAKRKQDRFKALLSGVTNLKNGTQQNGVTINTGKSEMEGYGGPGSNVGVQNFKDWYKTLQADKSIGDANNSIKAAGEVAAHLAAGGSINKLQAQVGLLRGAGLNRITNLELGATSGNQALGDRIEQAAMTLDTGNLTEANKAQYLSAAKVLSENAPMILEGLKRQHDLSARSFGLAPAQYKDVLDQKFSRIAPAGSGVAGPTAPVAQKYKIGDKVTDDAGKVHTKVKDGADADQANWKAD